MSDWLIRPAGPDDVAFIVNGWLEGYWPDCPCSLVMQKAMWWHRWHVVVENALADERNRTLVACSPDNQSYLYGFICARPPDILHWVYVKQPYRELGISKELRLDVGLRLPIRLSHWSQGADKMAGRERDLYRYDPRIIKEYQP